MDVSGGVFNVHEFPMGAPRTCAFLQISSTDAIVGNQHFYVCNGSLVEPSAEAVQIAAKFH